MAKLAFYTFAVLEEAFRHQHSRGFADRITGVFESAEQASGFVGCADSARDDHEAATLSLWVIWNRSTHLPITAGMPKR